MKTKQWIWGLSLVLITATTQLACDSKKEDKAEKVGEEYKDVIDAQKDGDTSKVQEEQAELDSARQDYKDMAKDSAR
jgi:cell fate regulator YaaT (PSP1 superfamily)